MSKELELKRVFGDRVIIEAIPRDTHRKTASGLLMPVEGKDLLRRGKILRVGTACEFPLEEGQIVQFKELGSEKLYKDDKDEGAIVLVNERQIVGDE